MYGYHQNPSSGPHFGPRRVVVPFLIAALLALLNVWLASGSSQATSSGLTASAGTPQARVWQPGAIYLQIGSSCVGYSLAAWLDAEPQPLSNHPQGWQIYQAAQRQDGIAQPHDGTTMEAGIEVLAGMGFVGSWQSTHDPSKALDFLRTEGPIVVDADFPQERPLFDSEDNLVWTGRLARHGWLCYGVDEQDRLSCQNSGSSSWNSPEYGRFHMTKSALARLLVRGLAWLIRKAPGAGA